MRHAGIVLAAGASNRMGRPKALLRAPGNVPLAAYQAALLRDAGCDPVVVVLGADCDLIAHQLGGCRVARNDSWHQGRLSSIQQGLRATSAEGYLILPVDTAGVRAETFRAVLRAAEAEPARAVRPMYASTNGKILWVSRLFAEDILTVDPRNPKARLDDMARDCAVRVDVDDPAILNNANTAEEWERIRASML